MLVASLSNKSWPAVVGMKKTIIEILNNSLDVEAAEKRIDECFKSVEHKKALLEIKEIRALKSNEQ